MTMHLKPTLLISLLFVTGSLFSQKLKGTIYAEELKAEYVIISNITRDVDTYTNENGYFEIEAQANDSISFSSSFYETKTIVVKEDFFAEEIIIELKQRVNSLDEVIISDLNFFEEEYNLKFKNQLAYDTDKNMQAYEQPSNGLVDFRKIFKRVKKLLTKKKKKPSNQQGYVTFMDLNLLFSREDFLNNKPLIEILDITKEKVPLFKDYCREKIDKELLDSKNEFLLIDRFFTLLSEFEMNVEDKD